MITILKNIDTLLKNNVMNLENRDFIPQNWESFAIWIMNFEAQMPVLAAKYGVTAEALAQLAEDAAWAKYYVAAMFALRRQEKQLFAYVKTVANKKPDATTPSAPIFALPAGEPPLVPVGVKARAREIANRIKWQKSIYTIADGRLLGIVLKDEVRRGESEYAPKLKISAADEFRVSFGFRKQGMHAVRFEYRRKDGDWIHLGDAAKSPAEFTVPPTAPDAPEQIEIRAVFLKNYKIFGSYSPIYTATIAP